MDWEDEDTERGWTRREWVKLGLTAGAVGTVASLGAATAPQIVPPPIEFSGEIREELIYTKFPTPQWWNANGGKVVKVADFDEEWRGAAAGRRGLFSDGNYVPGTGFPVIVIRVKRDLSAFTEPSGVELPEGFGLYHDEEPSAANENLGRRIVVVYAKCVHLCCNPGWHVVTSPPPEYSYIAPAPTYERFGKDPIYCVCHGSQYEPMSLVKNVNEKSGAEYVGARHVHGPAHRALPIVPVKSEGGTLVGGMADPRWYV